MRLESRSRRPGDVLRWLALLGALLLIGVVLGLLHRQGVSLCLFHRLTGCPCLTCGTMRALTLAASGDWTAAFRLQPLMLLLTALAAVAAGAYTYALLIRRRVLLLRLPPGEWRVGALVALVLALLNWLYLFLRGV